ncbi:MAG: hypothetical protein V3T30_08900, partial [Thermodesulfobacteriota bacterium]
MKDRKIGKTYGLFAPDEVFIHTAPSLDAQRYHFDQAQIFVIEEVVCADGVGKLNCYSDLILSKDDPRLAKVAFEKVRFESGEIGYINALYFYPKLSDYIISEKEAKALGTTPKGFVERSIRRHAEAERKYYEEQDQKKA